MAEELEIKLTLAPDALNQAGAWLSAQKGVRAGAVKTLVNRYFDTPAGDLNRRKVALRIRQAGDQFIQTLKARGEFVDGAHRRQEWEWPLIGPKLKLALIADTPVGQGVNLAGLQPVFETNFERRVLMVDQEDSVIEVAIDSGAIVAGGQSLPLNEIEFELKSGASSALLAWARRLADEVPVFLNLVSKAEQGYHLAGLYHPVPDAGKISDLAVNDFLFLLSVSWLTGERLCFARGRLDAIGRLAGELGVGELYQQVVTALADGTAVRDLVSGKELGQLQLAIAAGQCP